MKIKFAPAFACSHDSNNWSDVKYFALDILDGDGQRKGYCINKSLGKRNFFQYIKSDIFYFLLFFTWRCQKEPQDQIFNKIQYLSLLINILKCTGALGVLTSN